MGTLASAWWARAKLLALALLVAAGLAVAGAGTAHAGTFTVNSTGDSPDWNPGDGVCDIGDATRVECTLRAAIQQADATTGSDTVDFSVTGEITLTNVPGRGGLEVGTGEILTIDGPGAGVLAVNGSNQVRPFTIDSTARVTINGLTIKNGRAEGGGGIYNDGELTLNNSTIANNTSTFLPNRGGGIHNSGTLTLNRSTVSGNFGDLAGGISNEASGSMRINRSTIGGNTAGFSGGGIYNEGNFTLSGSTVSSNKAGTWAGGIFSSTGSDGVANINNSTISGNSAANDSHLGPGSNGGGMYLAGTSGIWHSTVTNNDIVHSGKTGNGVASEGSAGTVTFVKATIISGNADNSDVALDGGTTNSFGSQGYNLIGGGDAVGAFGGSDLTEVTDPLLGPLADYGGPTRTHALLPGSRAIDGAGPNPPDADQRGVRRPQDGDANGSTIADIGSYEKEPPPPNDDFARSQPVNDVSTSVNGRNTEATRESGEPDHLPDFVNTLGENSVWYGWKAPASGRVSLDVCTSSFDTVLAVYRGSLGSLSRVASDDDSCSAPNDAGSRVTFDAVAGITYRIAVAGYFTSSRGTFTLRLPDLVGPSIRNVFPGEGATAIAPNKNVIVTFSEPVKSSTINTTTIRLRKGSEPASVRAAVTYDAANRRAILDPASNLTQGRYVATVTPGVRDTADNSLDDDPATGGSQGKRWTFTVRE